MELIRSVTPPWETLRELLLERGISVIALARALEMSNLKAYGVCIGQIPIKGQLAHDLEKLGLGIAEFWEERTKRYEDYMGRRKGEQ